MKLFLFKDEVVEGLESNTIRLQSGFLYIIVGLAFGYACLTCASHFVALVLPCFQVARDSFFHRMLRIARSYEEEISRLYDRLYAR